MPKMSMGPVKTGRGFTNKDVAAKKKKMDVAAGKTRGYTDAQLAAKKKSLTPPKKAVEAGNRSTGSVSGQKRYNGPRESMPKKRGYTEAQLNAAKSNKMLAKKRAVKTATRARNRGGRGM